jgi:hypothetical protein
VEYEISRLKILSVNITYKENSFSRRQERNRLEVSESRVLRRIFGLQREEVTGVY